MVPCSNSIQYRKGYVIAMANLLLLEKRGQSVELPHGGIETGFLEYFDYIFSLHGEVPPIRVYLALIEERLS